MITDTDITKLKKAFKEEFATKDDLKKFATKDEMKEAVADLHVEIGEVRDTIETTAAAIGRIEVAIDGLVGAIQDLRTENSAGAFHLARHDRQIESLALATGVILPD